MIDSLDSPSVSPNAHAAEPPAAPAPATPITGERRRDLRYPLRFPCAIVFHRHSNPTIYQGATWNISMAGLCVALGSNIFTEEEITVRLVIPSQGKNEGGRIVECIGVMQHTVYSSEVGGFRIGISVKQFKADGRKILRQALETRS